MGPEKPSTPSAADMGQPGWEAALHEIEHQAQHWDTPEHGDLGHVIAEALRSAVDIARAGGLACEHRAARSD